MFGSTVDKFVCDQSPCQEMIPACASVWQSVTGCNRCSASAQAHVHAMCTCFVYMYAGCCACVCVYVCVCYMHKLIVGAFVKHMSQLASLSLYIFNSQKKRCRECGAFIHNSQMWFGLASFGVPYEFSSSPALNSPSNFTANRSFICVHELASIA